MLMSDENQYEDEWPKFFTVKEAARLLNISEKNIYRLIDAKLIPHFNFGKKSIRIGELDLIAFVKRHRVKVEQN